MTIADEIREYVLVAIMKPARRAGVETVTFTAAEIHNAMKLPGNYMPDVCSSLDAQKFLPYANTSLVRRSGPKQSTTARWTFKV